MSGLGTESHSNAGNHDYLDDWWFCTCSVELSFFRS